MKPMKLYEIADEIRMSLDMLFSGEGDGDEWEEKFDALEIVLDKKGLAIRHVLREITASGEVLKGEINRLQERKRVMDNAGTRLSLYAIKAMDTAGRDEIKVDGIGLKICATPGKTIVNDLNLLQEKHPELIDIVVETRPKLNEIKDWAKAHGITPDGVEINKGRRLRVD